MTEFTKQYAIRLPNGLLHGHKPGQYMFNSFGLISYAADESGDTEVEYYDKLEDVEAALKTFQDKAAHLGITEWLGRIETRWLTPFTDSSVDTGKDMLADLERFMEEQ